MTRVHVARLVAVVGVAAVLGGCALNPAKLLGGGKDKPPPEKKVERKENPEFWRKDGEAIAKQAQKGQTSKTKAKNIILFVGEGMSLSTVTAARILAGQNEGSKWGGEETALSFETFPATALAKTYNVDLQAPQAAGSMTALLTGIKTRGSSVSLTQEVLENDCGGATTEEPTLLERAKASGLAAGLVTTARITHAGPAAAYAHASSPNWEVDANVPPAAVAKGCRDIARQLVEFDQKGPLDVVFGGGRMAFKPEKTEEAPASAEKGVRVGPQNLIEAWEAGGANRQYLFAAGKLGRYKEGPVMGLFSPDHMSFEAQRPKDGDQPSLTAMTEEAITILKRNKEGFVLVVVASGIGRGHDQANAYLALTETIELANAVNAAVSMTDKDDTLIIVTADHGSTLALGGGAGRGSPILGAASEMDNATMAVKQPLTDAAQRPYPTLTYGSGPATPPAGATPPGANADATTYRNPAALALSVAATGGEDVPVYARGPGSQWIHGTLDQHAIYWIMRAANPTLERGKPIRKIAGITPPEIKVPKIKLPF